jgi:dTDP-4-amino-4,6-dideoxygalactose transaminase
VIAGAYFDQVNNPLIEMLATPQMPLSHVYHLFVVLADDPKALQSHLERFGVQSLIHYPIPVHRQPPCLDVLRDPMGLKFSEIHASRCISIPCHPQLKDDDVATIILALNCFGRQK